MKIINKKIMILFSAILLLSIMAFSVMPLLFADEENVVQEVGERAQAPVGADPAGGSKTIIDYIIENSNNTASKDQNYHILEIHSGSTPSSLKAFCDNANFEQLVFDGHRSSTSQTFNAGKLDYKNYNMKTDDATLIAAINEADLIYFSEDLSSEWTAANDISESVKDALAKFSTSDNKPIIFDSHSLGKQIQRQDSKTVEDLAKNYFAKYGSKNNTYAWPDDFSAGEFMNPGDLRALFVGAQGDVKKKNVWTLAKITEGTGDTATTRSEYIGKVLTICNGATDNKLTTSFKQSFDGAYTFGTGVVLEGDKIDETAEVLYLKNPSDVRQYGYFGNQARPNAMQFDTLDMSNATQFKAIGTTDLSQYDFVIIESGTKSVRLDTNADAEAVFNNLVASMYSKIHILYNKKLAPDGSGSDDPYKLEASNIGYVYDKIATPTDEARYPHVLITARKLMDAYTSSTTPKGVDDIANIINAGNFRGMGGFGDSSTVYTVLEVEPCYPIDTDLAAVLYDVRNTNDPLQGNKSSVKMSDRGEAMEKQWSGTDAGYYYLRTNGVSSSTADEITFGDGRSLSDLKDPAIGATYSLSDYVTPDNIANITDYYNWTLSKAKIAAATGRNINELNVVHMSSVEFATSRKTLKDNYDAIFFGGDYSAIKPEKKWYAKNVGTKVYTMYFHEGDAFNYRNNFNDKAGNYGFYGGNDLTYSKLKELQDYAKNMPVIVDTRLSNAFLSASRNENQTLLDPKSNMFTFLSGIATDTGSALEANSNNVLVNFDYTKTYKDPNLDSQYGDTYSGFVTLFNKSGEIAYDGTPVVVDANEVSGDKLGTLLNTTARPLLAVSEMPMVYSENDRDTWIDPATIGSGLEWKVDVSTSATVNLYIDDDSNGRFTKDEIVSTKTGKNVTLTFKPGADYYGVIYWKVEAVTGELSSSTTNVCKIKRTNQSKMYVNLLEIMPRGSLSKKASGEENNNLRTLYLCTDCQFAGAILQGNGMTDTGMFNHKFVGRVNTYKEGKPQGTFTSTANIANALKQFDNEYNYTGGDFGSHTHDFGIVRYYNDLTMSGATGLDDPYSNWFDIIREDYDVDTTILYADDYNSMVKDVQAKFAGKSKAVIDDMINGATTGFVEQYNKYYKYYLAMKAIINGDYTTKSGDTYSLDFAAIESAYPGFITEIGNAMSNASVSTNVNDTLVQYAASSFKMDDILTDNRTAICNSADKATAAEMGKAIDAVTNKDLPRDQRKYFNIFNNYNAPSGKVPDAYYARYCEWRDAKIFENFFFEEYQKNKRYASYDVDTKTIKLSEVYDCIAVGAADYFAYDDIGTEGCDALLNYVDDNGNVILFHDSLNVDNKSTSIMTQKLSTAFGMNARHMKLQTENTPDPKTVNASIGGTPIPSGTDINLGYDVKNRTVTLKQQAAPITATDNSVVVKVGSDQKNIAGLSNNDVGYDIEVLKKVEQAGVIKLHLAPNENEALYGGTKVIDVPANATRVVISYNYMHWTTWAQEPTVESMELGTSTATHNIEIVMQGNSQLVVGLNSNTNFARGDGNKAPNNGSFTISSANVSSETTSVTSYEIGTITKKTGTLTGNGLQQFDVTVKDASGATQAGETVEFTVNGDDGQASTATNGVATFYRENYSVSGYTVVSNETEPATSNGEQTLTIIILDVNGNPVQGKAVTASAAGQVSGDDTSVAYTDETGAATFVYKNYVESTPANPTVVPENPGDKRYFTTDKLNGISFSPRMLTMKGYQQFTDKGQMADANNYTLMYKYTSFHSKQVEPTVGFILIGQQSMQDKIAEGAEAAPTDKTQKNNEGIITKYPFGIGNRMQISATAPGDYAVDIEDDDLIVYYSCVGGSAGTSSSLFAADPMDGVNNYFLYQYGSVTYTGAGYSLITGWGRNNNDERKLYINIIVNSGRKSTKGPSLSLYDLDSTMENVEQNKANNVIKPFNGGTECDYYTEIEDMTDFKGFDFLASLPASSKLKKVQVFYDVNHTADGADGDGAYDYDSGTDIMIFNSDRVVKTDDKGDVIEDQSVVENMLKSIKSGITGMEVLDDGTTPAIALKDNCFDAQTGNQYAYIVVRVWDDKNPSNKESKVLRIQFKPTLFDLN